MGNTHHTRRCMVKNSVLTRVRLKRFCFTILQYCRQISTSSIMIRFVALIKEADSIKVSWNAFLPDSKVVYNEEEYRVKYTNSMK